MENKKSAEHGVLYAYVIENIDDGDARFIMATDTKRLAHYRKAFNVWKITPLYVFE